VVARELPLFAYGILDELLIFIMFMDACFIIKEEGIAYNKGFSQRREAKL
jgi:hypothetical protein